MPKVSIIIPVYNVEKYLSQCLESVVSQTLFDIEIICINDSTEDNAQEILDSYAAKDTRFLLLKHQHNMGLPAARNTGLSSAKGEYIYFIDSDDFIPCNDALETLYQTALSDRADETIGGVYKWREDTGEKYLDWHEKYLKKEFHAESLSKLPQLSANVVAWNKLIKRSFLEKHGVRFNENIRKNEDNPFSCQVHILARRISIILKTTYVYRQIAESIMYTHRKADATYCCLYCHDIFKFIESAEDRHIFRKMYYPMYSRQLIGSAKILSQFSPSNDDIEELMVKWRKIVDILPDDLCEIPQEHHAIYAHIRANENQEAWETALRFSRQQDVVQTKNGRTNETFDVETLEAELSELKEVNLKLSSQIEAVWQSKSMRMTAPLRYLFDRIGNVK